MVCSVNARHVDPTAKYYLVAGGRRQVDLIYISQKYATSSTEQARVANQIFTRDVTSR